MWLGESDCPDLLICSFDYDRRRASFFRSNTSSSTSSSRQAEVSNYEKRPLSRSSGVRASEATLAQAIHASSNAPVQYFMSPAEFNDTCYWDGAIAGYNNPIMAALTEAYANGSNSRQREIQILSIGTGTVSLPSGAPEETTNVELLRAGPRTPTLFGDLGQLAGAILDDPPESATFVAHVMLGQPLPTPNQTEPIAGNIVRISPLVRPVRAAGDGRWTLPEALSLADFKALLSLELDAVNDADIQRLVTLGQLWITGEIANQPIRESRNFQCQIGFPNFESAKTHWLQLMNRI